MTPTIEEQIQALEDSTFISSHKNLYLSDSMYKAILETLKGVQGNDNRSTIK